ncbi:MAG: DUF1266 domain-containing protein [Planctomycetes bacterium]|nr:DUF1266 domain-containing protein [Planctomycetota bacterium]
MLASIWTVLLIAVGSLVGVLVLAFGGLLLLASRMTKAIEASMAEDAQDPARAWLQVAFGFINYRDPAYASGDVACQASLKRDWSIDNRDDLLKRADRLALMLPADPAWHGVRLINMLRIGAGAGYLSQEESWRRALEVGRQVKAAHDSWQGVADAMNAALDKQKGEWVAAARKSLNENLAQLKQSNFRGVAYDTSL